MLFHSIFLTSATDIFINIYILKVSLFRAFHSADKTWDGMGATFSVSGLCKFGLGAEVLCAAAGTPILQGSLYVRKEPDCVMSRQRQIVSGI